jgi:hypothetical protein
MVDSTFTTHLGLRSFCREELRRPLLAGVRRAAARRGYRGRMSFRHYGIHGRTRGVVEVKVYP